ADGAHNARYQQGGAKVRVRYAFHPRFGEEIIVVGRQRYCGEPAYVGRQPDGSLALVPIWMSEESAASMVIVDVPRFPLVCLRDLRREIDAGLKLLRDDSRRGGDSHGAKATAQAATTRPVFSSDTDGGCSDRCAGTPPSADLGPTPGSERPSEGGRS
ncbi:MAG: hypothetical protein P4L99_13680, partial [Chthoniobacter sp.]|nr:hypothetical protein [Chthoniobacter sp.]